MSKILSYNDWIERHGDELHDEYNNVNPPLAYGWWVADVYSEYRENAAEQDYNEIH